MKIVPDKALQQHIAILGKTGSGKSYAGKGIVEGLLNAKRQVVIIDPTSAWWGMRLSANGKSKGFDLVLLGGPHADIPLSSKSGSAVGRLVALQKASVIIDTSELTVAEYTAWFTEFAQTVYSHVKNPLHLVIDEAHQFMPQGKVPDPAAGKMLHAGNRLMSGGRSRGIRAMLITQRPAKLHKDSLTCADTLIAMRVIAPQDRKAIKEWIDGSGNDSDGKMVMDSLAQLARGEGWVWYPEGGHLVRTKFPSISSYDSSAAPEHDKGRHVEVGDIDLSEVQSALAEALAEAEANDPKKLKGRIAELERQIKSVGKQQPVYKCEHGPLLAHQRETIGYQNREIQRLSKQIQRAYAVLGEVGASLPPEPAQSQIRESVKQAPTVVGKRTVEPKVNGSGHTNLSKAEQKLLDALALGESFGEPSLSREALAAIARMSVTSSYFERVVGALRTQGFVAYPESGMVSLTESGSALAKHESFSSRHELHERWLSVLTSAEQRIVRCLIDRYPQPLTREELAEATDMSVSSSYFERVVGHLRTLGAAIYPSKGNVRASDLLFPEGLQ